MTPLYLAFLSLCILNSLEARYVVSILTTDTKNADTDSSFFYTFLGTNGESKEYKADNLGNDRQRGNEDTWKFADEVDIGGFRCILIRMEGRDRWIFKEVNITIDGVPQPTISNHLSWFDDNMKEVLCIPGYGPCEAGQQLTPDRRHCVNCPANQWSSAWNGAACTECPPGTEVAAGEGKQENDCTSTKVPPVNEGPRLGNSNQVKWCGTEVENNDVFGNYTWLSTEPGTVATLPCVYKLKGSKEEFATKLCVVGEVKFSDTNFTNCPSRATQRIKDILKESVTEETQDTISNNIAEVAKNQGNLMSSSDIKDTSAIINNVIAVGNLSDASLDNLISAVDGIQTLSRRDQLQIGDTGGSIRKSTTNILLAVTTDKEEEEAIIIKKSIGFAVGKKTQNIENKEEQLLALAGTANSLSNSTNEENQPNTYFQAKLQTIGDNIASAVYYQNDKSFASKAATSMTDVVKQIKANTNDPVKNKKELSVVATVIADIQIIDKTASAVVPLDDGTNVNMMFRVTDFESTISTVTRHVKRKTYLQSTLQCNFYDENLNKWSNRGCKKTLEHNDTGNFEVVNCICDHLTSFAVLMSFEVVSFPAEEMTTRILLIISIVGLSLTIISHLPNRKLMKTRSIKIHLMLSVSLLCSIILLFIMDIFVAEEEETDPSIPCFVIGVLLNYFWLTQLCWMVVEAVTIYMALVKVLGVHISRAMIKFSVFAWGSPVLFPLIGYAWGRNKFIDPKTCFVSRPFGFATFYAPVALGVLTNWILFIFIAKVIVAKSRAKAEQNPENHSEIALKMKQAKSALTVSSLLGLGWIVGFFLIFNNSNYSQISVIVRWLFILINAPQGFFVFVFYVLLRDDLCSFWIEIFKCGLTTTDSVPIPNTRTTSATSATSATSGQRGHSSARWKGGRIKVILSVKRYGKNIRQEECIRLKPVD